MIRVIPTGGLGNRMRAIASGVAIAQHYDIPIEVYWNIRDGLHAEFTELFKPVVLDNVAIRTNRSWLCNIEFRKEYLVRYPLLWLNNKKVIFNHDIYREGDKNIFQIIGDKVTGDIMLVSGCAMCRDYDMKSLFIPSDEIQHAIDKTVSKFSDDTIGVHIRRTDNKESIECSPLDAFYRMMDNEIEKNSNVRFYLATDDNSTKSDMQNKYSDRLITQFDKTERNSLAGMKFAVNDLYCLSKTKKIIGSVYSSYSSIASELGQIPIEYAKK